MRGRTRRHNPPTAESMALDSLRDQYVHGSLELDELERQIEKVLTDPTAALSAIVSRPRRLPDPMTPQTH